jgi:hypothetical protein
MTPRFASREALGWYHKKKSTDPERDIGLGPNHDWSSQAADAFGLMCIHYDQPDGAPPPEPGAARSAAARGKVLETTNWTWFHLPDITKLSNVIDNFMGLAVK